MQVVKIECRKLVRLFIGYRLRGVYELSAYMRVGVQIQTRMHELEGLKRNMQVLTPSPVTDISTTFGRAQIRRSGQLSERRR